MLPHQKILWPCPFCEKETLLVLWWPSHKEAHTSRSAVTRSTTVRRKKEGLVLLSEKCSNCGKTAKEIEKSGENEVGKTENRQRKWQGWIDLLANTSVNAYVKI